MENCSRYERQRSLNKALMRKRDFFSTTPGLAFALKSRNDKPIRKSDQLIQDTNRSGYCVPQPRYSNVVYSYGIRVRLNREILLLIGRHDPDCI